MNCPRLTKQEEMNRREGRGPKVDSEVKWGEARRGEASTAE